MKVVLTGAAGFIGSHLAARYVNDGHTVVGIDNFITGSPDNLTSVQGRDTFHFVQHDVSHDWSPISDHLNGADLVLHFASPASPVDYGANPIETILVNGIGTRNALEFASSTGARFLFASTSETYGDPLVHPQTEAYWGNVNPIGLRSCYDESKRYGEAMTVAYARSKGADIRLIRIFNTYGPRMRRNDGRVVPNFVTQALEGRPLTIYGDGSQTRSFCYVDDLVEGIVRSAAAESTKGLVVNLGNPEEYTIRHFAELVCEIIGVELTFVTREMPSDDPTRRCPDITRAKTLLDWTPKVAVRDGLERTIAYFGGRAREVT